MAKIVFTPAIEKEYESLFNNSQILLDKRDLIDRVVNTIIPNKHRYQAVVENTQVPWAAVAAIHNLESSLSFHRHLHNGDSLKARTVQVPAGRPPKSVGEPPFSWEISAWDALFNLKKWNTVTDWSMGRLLYEVEKYNGFGYRLAHPEVKSPYLWSMTNLYVRGKYVADSKWSDTAVSKQVGACAVLRRLLELQEDFVSQDKEIKSSFPLTISSGPIPYGDILQNHLNQFPGINLLVDSWTGPETSRAFYLVYGSFLKGDSQGTARLRSLLDAQRLSLRLPIRYSHSPLSSGYGSLLQESLNRYPGIFVRVDNHPSKRTADAFFSVYGVPLLGDPTR